MLICSQLDPKPTKVIGSSYSFLFSITLHKASRFLTLFFTTQKDTAAPPPGKQAFGHYAVTRSCQKESKVTSRFGKRLEKAAENAGK